MLLSPARSVGSPECKTLRQMSFEEAVPYLLKDQKSQEQWSTPELVNDSDLDAMEKYPFLLSGFQPEIHEVFFLQWADVVGFVSTFNTINVSIIAAKPTSMPF